MVRRGNQGPFHDVDIDTNENIWRVLYDDGDEADYNAVQMKRILCVT
jgi:hypothetical protein